MNWLLTGALLIGRLLIFLNNVWPCTSSCVFFLHAYIIVAIVNVCEKKWPSERFIIIYLLLNEKASFDVIHA